MIWFIILLGLILRLINLNQSLWLDEAIVINASKNYSLFDLIVKYSVADFHPPGYFILIWFWGRLGNFSEVWMRIPSVIFALLTIRTVYLIGTRLQSKYLGLVSALLLAVNPLHIYYSQEARMYSFAAFAVSLSTYLFIKLLKGAKLKAVFIIPANILVLLSDYLAYFIFPAQFLLLLIYKQKGMLKIWLTGLSLSALFSIILIPIIYLQLNTGSSALNTIPAWKYVVGEFGLKSLSLTYVKFIIGRISYPDKLVYFLSFIPVGLLVASFIWGAIKNQKEKTIKLGILLLFPVLLVQVASLFIPIYSYFRLLFVLPIFVMIISLGIVSLNRLKIIFIPLFVFICLFYSTIYFTNPAFQREDWRGVVEFLKKQPNSLTLFESSGIFSPFEYYSTNHLMTAEMVPGFGALKNMPAKEPDDLIDLKNKLNGTNDVYLIDYLVEISDPKRLVKIRLEGLGYKLRETINFNGVGFVYRFKR